MTRLWRETADDPSEVERRLRAIFEAEIGRDVELRPVHEAAQPVVDPDEVPQRYDVSKAEMLGRPVDVGCYEPGTWFYYGTGKVFVRRKHSDAVERVEAR